MRETNKKRKCTDQNIGESNNSSEQHHSSIFLRAPILSSNLKEDISKWKEEYELFVNKVKEQNEMNGTNIVPTSIKESIEQALLRVICKYEFKKSEEEVTNEEIMIYINEQVMECSLKSKSSIDKVMKQELHYDLKDQNISRRVFNLFKSMEDIKIKYGLDKKIKGEKEVKYLISALKPNMLKEEIEDLIEFEHQDCKEDTINLYQLIKMKAEDQHKYYLRANNNKKIIDSSKEKNYDKRKPKRQLKCFHCDQPHRLRDCPIASNDDKDKAMEKYRKQKETSKIHMKCVQSTEKSSNCILKVNDVVEIPYILDTGCDVTIVPNELIKEVQKSGQNLKITKLKENLNVQFGTKSFSDSINEYVNLKLEIYTKNGSVIIQEKCYIYDNANYEILLSNELLKRLGIDINHLLDNVVNQMNMKDYSEKDQITEDYNIDIGQDNENDIHKLMEKLVMNAMKEGFPKEYETQLRNIIFKYPDIWRIKIGFDDSAKVEPYEVQLVQNYKPYKCRMRKYSIQQQKFMKTYINELIKYGLMYKNNKSKWACSAHPIPKPGSNEFRLTSNYIPVNIQTQGLAGTMMNIETKKQHLKDKKYFFLGDLFKGFWQLPMHTNSQEIFSIMLDDGIYTPTRLVQGATDSAIWFQSIMDNILQEKLNKNFFIWIDDVLGFAETITEFLEMLEFLFDKLQQYNLKLSIKKTKLFMTEVKWCSRIIDGDGMKYDPDYYKAIIELPKPTTAAHLQKFLCGINWMRSAIPEYNKKTMLLQMKLEEVLKNTKRTKRIAAGIPIQLNEKESDSYQNIKDSLTTIIKLSHPNDDAEFCLFTDASGYAWGVVLTQVKQWNNDISITEQDHEPIMFLSGTFKNAELNWSICEKEAFPIIISCIKLDYLLLRRKGFTIFTDHRNLSFIFNPGNEIKKYTTDRLIRWTLRLARFKYKIQHINGEENIWADIISRWTNESDTITNELVKVQIKRVALLKPLHEAKEFEWPNLNEIKEQQIKFFDENKRNIALEMINGIYYKNNLIWIPSACVNLKNRILIISHYSNAGHRGISSTINNIKKVFWWNNLEKIVQEFIDNCVYCKHINSGNIIQRPYTSKIHADIPNEILHFDYIYIGETYGQYKYIFLMKDNFSHFCRLVPYDIPNAENTINALLNWHADFGLPNTLVSDQGTHHKNRVVEAICHRLQIQQKFTIAYSPWINGSIERLGRDVLKVFKALILEFGISERDWISLLHIVQHNLNHTPVNSLGKKAPVEIFSKLPCHNNLDFIFRNKEQIEYMDQTQNDRMMENFKNLRESIYEMHQDVMDARKKQRILNELNHRGAKILNIAEGDFVLWSSVDHKKKNKLNVTWTGPFQVIKATSDSTYLIKHLLNNKRIEAHSSRLKFFADKDLEINEELLQYISNQGLILNVEKIVSHRYNKNKKTYELEIKWMGFQQIENSFEDLKIMRADIPKLVYEYVKNSKDNKFKKFTEKLL